VDIRIDDDSMHTSYMWANQARIWVPGFNPKTEGGSVTFLAEGEKPTEIAPITPEETEPEETEKADEPKDTGKVEKPKDTEKADTPNTDATDKEAPAAASFPIVPVVIAAVALITIVIVVIMLAKKKKK
jgi:hypothetical protein